ncbi:hypothetical protein BC835DRAFT_1339109 [Cytidiella melzeri]|nr:hypothetical protein BC835DRAFT_1339109 [Cytidiella melzeri]
MEETRTISRGLRTPMIRCHLCHVQCLQVGIMGHCDGQSAKPSSREALHLCTEMQGLKACMWPGKSGSGLHFPVSLSCSRTPAITVIQCKNRINRGVLVNWTSTPLSTNVNKYPLCTTQPTPRIVIVLESGMSILRAKASWSYSRSTRATSTKIV